MENIHLLHWGPVTRASDYAGPAAGSGDRCCGTENDNKRRDERQEETKGLTKERQHVGPDAQRVRQDKTIPEAQHAADQAGEQNGIPRGG